MGIRMTQHAGLNQWAQDFVRGEQVLVCHELRIRDYPDGRRERHGPYPVYGSSVRKEEGDGSYSGMFEEEGRYPLHKYTLPDWRVFWEVVQAEPWSSGPVVFLALSTFSPDEIRWICREYGELDGILAYGKLLQLLVPKSLWTDAELANA